MRQRRLRVRLAPGERYDLTMRGRTPDVRIDGASTSRGRRAVPSGANADPAGPGGPSGANMNLEGRGGAGPRRPRATRPDTMPKTPVGAKSVGARRLTDVSTVRDLLANHGIWLTKTLGQHLLTDDVVLNRIVLSARLHPKLEVLEVGPGAGALTAELVTRVRRVVAVEVDRRMVRALRTTVDAPNLEIVEADALAIDPATLFEARPGDLSVLGVQVQVMADVQVLFEVPPQAFFPPPDVTSAVIRLRPYDEPCVPLLPSPARFLQTVRAGFAHRRKQLHNALGDLGTGTERIDAALEATGIARTRRAETLTLAEWSALSEAIWPVSGETAPPKGDPYADDRDGIDAPQSIGSA
ncbi:MAG: methyltransferase domain-containing protein [Proteobacteria bacterium]|nr:methyltransferase domain-containing protein [Pseudomonadota bacterium]